MAIHCVWLDTGLFVLQAVKLKREKQVFLLIRKTKLNC